MFSILTLLSCILGPLYLKVPCLSQHCMQKFTTQNHQAIVLQAWVGYHIVYAQCIGLLAVLVKFCSVDSQLPLLSEEHADYGSARQTNQVFTCLHPPLQDLCQQLPHGDTSLSIRRLVLPHKRNALIRTKPLEAMPMYQKSKIFCRIKVGFKACSAARSLGRSWCFPLQGPSSCQCQCWEKACKDLMSDSSTS